MLSAVGSILVYWNDYIPEDQHIELQDTNDIYPQVTCRKTAPTLWFRVLPQITPDRLIVLGEVAKESDLYTKITGGQRVDLFGAQQLNELPIIWKN
ncbi:hypothetical protein O9992_26950 [Vibrio lentus]|nr:hypothetical protein [Vibrio lentus]